MLSEEQSMFAFHAVNIFCVYSFYGNCHGSIRWSRGAEVQLMTKQLILSVSSAFLPSVTQDCGCLTLPLCPAQLAAGSWCKPRV